MGAGVGARSGDGYGSSGGGGGAWAGCEAEAAALCPLCETGIPVGELGAHRQLRLHLRTSCRQVAPSKQAFPPRVLSRGPDAYLSHISGGFAQMSLSVVC